jgi:hypothetical protein
VAVERQGNAGRFGTIQGGLILDVFQYNFSHDHRLKLHQMLYELVDIINTNRLISLTEGKVPWLLGKMRNEIRAMELFFGVLGIGGGCTPNRQIQPPPQIHLYYLIGTFAVPVGLEPHPNALTLVCAVCVRSHSRQSSTKLAIAVDIWGVLHTLEHPICTPIWDFRCTPIRFAS